MNYTSRNIIFLCICLSIRLLLAHMISIQPSEILKIIGYIFFFPAIGFLYLSIKGKEKGFFRGKAWWSVLRPIHSLIYFLVAILSISGIKWAYLPLYLDVIIGFIGFIILN